MTISVIIPHVPKTAALDRMLRHCVISLNYQYDELIQVLNEGVGFGKAFNDGFKQATGDFVIGVSNDTTLERGMLADLCDPEAVTSPLVISPFHGPKAGPDHFWGCFFCLPRYVLEEIGGFDPRFGLAYGEDLNYVSRLKRAGIPMRTVDSVVVAHELGGGNTVKALGADEGALQKQNRLLYAQIEGELNAGGPLYVPYR